MRYWQALHWRKTFVGAHILLAAIIVLMFNYGNQWLNQMNSVLYLDKVVHSQKTRYQQLTFTERNMGGLILPIRNLAKHRKALLTFILMVVCSFHLLMSIYITTI